MKHKEMPDPKDRTPNEPSIVIEKDNVYDLYAESCIGRMPDSDEEAHRWINEKALREGWLKTEILSDGAVVLRANVKLIPPTG